MILIEARCVILNILADKDEIDLKQLQSFAVAVKKKFHEVYVDISDEAVMFALERYDDCISLKDNVITKTDKFGLFADKKFLDKTINTGLPVDIKKCLHKCAENLK